MFEAHTGRLTWTELPDGATISYAYNNRGLLATRSSDTATDEFSYDALGRMTSAVREFTGQVRSTVTFTYDALGRLTSETQQVAGTTARTLTYDEYDQADRLTQMTLPGGEVLEFTYTDGGQVETIVRDDDLLVQYFYDGPAVEERRVFAVADDPNAYVAWTVQRDGLLRMRTSSNVRVVGPDPNDHLTLASFTYERAVMGVPEGETVTPLVGPAQPRRFDYDPLDRLVQVTYGTDPNRAPDPNTDPYEAFDLDLAGNRIEYDDRQGNTTYYEPNAGNVSNQYSEITPGVDEPNYDPAGNLILDHRGYEYFYDADNHLTRVEGATGWLATYQYDALGRRIAMVDFANYPAFTVRQCIYAGQNVVEEYDVNGQRLCYYVHGPSYIDERVLMYDEATEADYVYLLKDLYTVAGLADARGWVVEAYDYDAYGKVTMRRCAVLPDAADYDADGDVDDDDFDVFDAHQNGPGNDPCDVTDPSVIPGWRSDFDGDGDVDGSDYIVFAHAYAGAGVSPRGDRMLLSGPMPASRVSNPYFFTGRRLDLLDIDDANTPNHFTDDTARLPLYCIARGSWEWSVC